MIKCPGRRIRARKFRHRKGNRHRKKRNDKPADTHLKGTTVLKAVTIRLSCAHFENLTSEQRLKKTAKFSGAFFGLAVVSVFLPIAHFVLVPGFLLTSLIGGIRTWYKDVHIKSASIRCPGCRHGFEIKNISI